MDDQMNVCLPLSMCMCLRVDLGPHLLIFGHINSLAMGSHRTFLVPGVRMFP